MNPDLPIQEEIKKEGERRHGHLIPEIKIEEVKADNNTLNLGRKQQHHLMYASPHHLFNQINETSESKKKSQTAPSTPSPPSTKSSGIIPGEAYMKTKLGLQQNQKIPSSPIPTRANIRTNTSQILNLFMKQDNNPSLCSHSRTSLHSRAQINNNHPNNTNTSNPSVNSNSNKNVHGEDNKEEGENSIFLHTPPQRARDAKTDSPRLRLAAVVGQIESPGGRKGRTAFFQQRVWNRSDRGRSYSATSKEDDLSQSSVGVEERESKKGIVMSKLSARNEAKCCIDCSSFKESRACACVIF